MAKKKDNTATTLLLVGGGGLLIWTLLGDNNNNNGGGNNGGGYNFNNVPQAPPPSTPEWHFWVNAVVGTFGNVVQLWQPGGPFYNQNTGAVEDEVGAPTHVGSGYDENTGVPCWENPYGAGC